MLTWLAARKDGIGALTGILGLLIGVGGFVVTNIQLSNTNGALRASNTYQIQKDARELLDRIAAKAGFREALRSGITDQNRDEFLDNLWMMLNFYLSVYRQARAGGLSGEFQGSFERDFCSFVRIPAVDNGWRELVSAARIGPSHSDMRRRWCGGR